jgi:hypothetical protein
MSSPVITRFIVLSLSRGLSCSAPRSAHSGAGGVCDGARGAAAGILVRGRAIMMIEMHDLTLTRVACGRHAQVRSIVSDTVTAAACMGQAQAEAAEAARAAQVTFPPP